MRSPRRRRTSSRSPLHRSGSSRRSSRCWRLDAERARRDPNRRHSRRPRRDRWPHVPRDRRQGRRVLPRHRGRDGGRRRSALSLPATPSRARKEAAAGLVRVLLLRDEERCVLRRLRAAVLAVRRRLRGRPAHIRSGVRGRPERARRALGTRGRRRARLQPVERRRGRADVGRGRARAGVRRRVERRRLQGDRPAADRPGAAGLRARLRPGRRDRATRVAGGAAAPDAGRDCATRLRLLRGRPKGVARPSARDRTRGGDRRPPAYNRAVNGAALIPPAEFNRVVRSEIGRDERLALLADMCRLNALVAVKRAGSGHLGSTFSSLDVVVHLLWEELNVARVGFDSPDRDVFFSSKGHDVPGLYAALNALGVVPTERLLRLRRIDGLDGHPDVGVPGIEANSGSLGMGISKGRGIAWAKRHLGRDGRVVVMTGDGELQEGQNWEALQAAAHQRVGRLLVLVDRNELQSDRATEEILALESLEAKLRAFGCRVVTCDGHDHAMLGDAFAELWKGDDGTPGVLIARTIKGKGVTFMEHPAALAASGGTYRWHAGAPDDEAHAAALAELHTRIDERFAASGLAPLVLEDAPPLSDARGTSLQGEPESGAGTPARSRTTDEYVAVAYGEALLELA